MSQLEDLVKPILLPIILDAKTTRLDEEKQLTVALWVLKTAIVMDALDDDDPRVFFTPAERHGVQFVRFPKHIQIWLAAYAGPRRRGPGERIGVAAVRRFRTRHLQTPSFLATFSIAHFVFQLLAIHCLGGKSRGQERPCPDFIEHPSWDGVSISITQPTDICLKWPPQRVLLDAALDQFAERWDRTGRTGNTLISSAADLVSRPVTPRGH